MCHTSTTPVAFRLIGGILGIQVSSEDPHQVTGAFYDSVFRACQLLAETHDEWTTEKSEQARGEFRGRLLTEMILHSGKPAALPPYAPPTPLESSSAGNRSENDGRSGEDNTDGL